MENRSTPESACPGRKVDAVWKIPFHDHHEQYSHLESFIRCLRGKSTGFSPALTVPERLGSQVHGCPFKALQQQLQRLPEVRIRQSSEFVGYALCV